jgi:DNA-binding IclR family transcriptional regulator
VRGRILNVLVEGYPLSLSQIVQKTGMEDERVKKNLAPLEKEGFIRKRGGSYCIYEEGHK